MKFISVKEHLNILKRGTEEILPEKEFLRMHQGSCLNMTST